MIYPPNQSPEPTAVDAVSSASRFTSPPSAVAQLSMLGSSGAIQKIMKAYRKIGLVGLAIEVVVNLVALLVFKKKAAEFFSEQWWFSWFPSYIFWLVFIVLGFVACYRGKYATDRQ
jgi:hypothetical protein